MSRIKKPFNMEILNELTECIFGYKTVEELIGKTFTGEWIKQNGALQKYIEKDMTPKIVESELVHQCGGLKISYDKLKELNIVNIYKNLLKKYTNYRLSSGWNNTTKSPIYYLSTGQ